MPMLFEQECYAIRGAIFEVYANLGSGFAEEVYQEALEMELGDRGIPFISHPHLQIRYKDRLLPKVYVPDLVCFGKIILELKALKSVLPEHEAQLINYLKATSLQLGLLVNFGAFPRADIRSFGNSPNFIRNPAARGTASCGDNPAGQHSTPHDGETTP